MEDTYHASRLPVPSPSPCPVLHGPCPPLQTRLPLLLLQAPAGRPFELHHWTLLTPTPNGGLQQKGGVGRSGRSGDFIPGSLSAGLPHTNPFSSTNQRHSSGQVQPSQCPGGGDLSPTPGVGQVRAPLSLALHYSYGSLPPFVDHFFPLFSDDPIWCAVSFLPGYVPCPLWPSSLWPSVTGWFGLGTAENTGKCLSQCLGLITQ